MTCLSKGQRTARPWRGNRVRQSWHTVWPHSSRRGTLSPWRENTSSHTPHSSTCKWTQNATAFQSTEKKLGSYLNLDFPPDVSEWGGNLIEEPERTRRANEFKSLWEVQLKGLVVYQTVTLLVVVKRGLNVNAVTFKLAHVPELCWHTEQPPSQPNSTADAN